MSCKVSKSGVMNSKVLMTKWDVNCIDRLTRADFYNDHFQPRDAFLIPQGVVYPNERTMLKAMNEIQSGLKNGNGKEWKIVQGRRGSRVVRLYDPGEAPVKDRSPPPYDVPREHSASSQVGLQRKESITAQRSHKTEAKRSEASSPTTKNAPRSIFTVNERRNDIQGQNRQEAVIGSMPPREALRKATEKRDLEIAIHGLEDFEQYTHEQLQKILDENKKFYQVNKNGQPSTLSRKQIENALTSQEIPKRNKTLNSLESHRAERILNEGTPRGKDVSSEVDVKENVRSKIDPKKSSCVSEKDNKKHELSYDDWSDEKYDFADYHENNSESSWFDTDSNKCDNLVSENDQDPDTMVETIQSDNSAESYIPPVHTSRHKHGMMNTGLGKCDQIDMPGSKLKKRFPTGGVSLSENEGCSGEGMSVAENHWLNKSTSKLTKGFITGDVTVNDEIKTGGFHVKSKPVSKKGTSTETKSVLVKESRSNATRSQGNISYNTKSINEYCRESYKPLRKQPATSTIASSHTVNQRKKNAEIDMENNRLSAKLELIKRSAPKNSITFRTSRTEQLPFARIQRRISKKSINDQ